MWQATPFTLPLLVTGAALFASAAYLWTRAPRPRASVELAVVTLGIGLHSFAYALELSSTSLGAKLFWLDVEMIGIASIPVTAVAFACTYAGRPLSPQRIALLSVVPVLAMLLVWTNDWHASMLTNTELIDTGTYVLRHSDSGWAWWVFLVYMYVCLAFTAVSYVAASFRGSRVHRRQARLLLLGLLVPLIANVVFQFSRVSPIDTTPIAYFVTAIAWTWAVTREGLVDLTPIAQDLILAMMDEAVLVLDARGRILDSNRAARALLGTSDSPVGHTPSDLLGIDHPLREHLERGTPSVEIAIGDHYYTLASRPLTTRDDDTQGKVFVLRDTTLRREVEDAREAALAAARETTRKRTELLARTSHEVRTPLHGILGSAELLADTKLDPAQRRWVDAIRGAGKSLLGVVDGVLELEQVRAGVRGISASPFPLTATLQSIVDLFEGTAHERGLHLRVVTRGELPGHVLGDERTIRQIVSNLVGNAVKFAVPGSVTISVSAEADDVSIEVRDEGPGIPPGTMEHLFEPFRPGSDAHSRDRAGAGLGLALARQLAQSLGGTLTIRVERGTVATLSLPLPATSADEASESAPSQPSSGARVLVVEDHPVNAAIARATLESEGCTVVEAHTALEALALLETERFDLVLMDLHLPDLSGLEAVQRLRERERETGRTPAMVVAVSADVLGPAGPAARDAGMNDTMPKPFDRTKMRALLSRIGATSTKRSSSLPPEIWATFVETANADVRALRDAASKGDRGEIRRVAHGLHGASLFVNATMVAASCEAVLREDGAELTPVIDRLASAVERVTTEAHA